MAIDLYVSTLTVMLVWYSLNLIILVYKTVSLPIRIINTTRKMISYTVSCFRRRKPKNEYESLRPYYDTDDNNIVYNMSPYYTSNILSRQDDVIETYLDDSTTRHY